MVFCTKHGSPLVIRIALLATRADFRGAISIRHGIAQSRPAAMRSRDVAKGDLHEICCLLLGRHWLLTISRWAA